MTPDKLEKLKPLLKELLFWVVVAVVAYFVWQVVPKLSPVFVPLLK